MRVNKEHFYIEPEHFLILNKNAKINYYNKVLECIIIPQPINI